MQESVKLFALGGLGEFGKNLMVIAQGNDAVIVDCGAMFSDGRNPGIDIIIPDFTPLIQADYNIHAALLTHAHEDHIGSIAYFLDQFPNVPVYGTKFTHALVSHKCKEFMHKINLDFRFIEPLQTFSVGPFRVHTVSMAHSIVEAMAFFIDTAQGRIFHTGDFKIDHNPPDGHITDLESIEHLSREKKVIMMFSDSTNVMVPGLSKSESSVTEGLSKAFEQTKGRLIITSFASHIPRVKQICTLAQKYDRKILFLGRSMTKNVKLGRELGHLDIPESCIVDEKQAALLKREKLVIVCTGTQAEPRAALSKMTMNQFRGLNLQKDDRVIFSSRAIPGNEREIYHLINHIYRTGATVWTSDDERIHVSGHAYKEDLATMLRIVRPKHFMPVHGELRMLARHQELSWECGIPKDDTFFVENGTELTIEDGKVFISGQYDLNPKLIDHGMQVALNSKYLKDRNSLAETGIIAVSITVDFRTLNMLHKPIVEEYGFIPKRHRNDFKADVIDKIEKKLADLKGKNKLPDLEVELKNWVRQVTRSHFDQKPVIIPVVIQA